MNLTEEIPSIFLNGRINARMHVDSPYVYYGDTNASLASREILSELKGADYKEEILYINHCFKSITVTKRNGFEISVPFQVSNTSRDFIIRKIITISNSTLTAAIGSLSAISNVDGKELQELKKCFINLQVENFKTACVMIDQIVTPEDIESRGGAIYHYESDIVISFCNVLQKLNHPYSPSFVNIGSFGKLNNYQGQKELNIKIRFVNHDPKANKKYVNLAGIVFELIPQKDGPAKHVAYRGKLGSKPTSKVFDDYIQIFYSANSDPTAPPGKDGVVEVKLTLEDATVILGLYDTYDEAFCLGDPDSRNKKTLLEMSHQLEIVKKQFLIEKEGLEKTSIARKEELVLKEHEIILVKGELAEKSHELERVILENKRKNTTVDSVLQEIQNERKRLDNIREDQERSIETERKRLEDINARIKEKHDQSIKQARDRHEDELRRIRDDSESRIRRDNLYWKDHYEMKSMVRKDTSEFSKFLPGLVIGIGGIIATWAKMSQDAKKA